MDVLASRVWQWLFLVEGLPPILIGVLFLRYLPDSPHDAQWLTASERAWIIHRLELDGELSPRVH